MSALAPLRAPVSRRGFRGAAGSAGILGGLAGGTLTRAALPPSGGQPELYPASPAEALKMLMSGNER